MSAALDVPADAAGSPDSIGRDGRLPPALFVGLVVTATGGPLALVVQNVPSGLQEAAHSPGPALLLAVAVFLAPLAVWLGFARHVRGPGGLAAYVEAAVGRRAALVQAAIWTVSYLAYLLYTVGYVAGDVLPAQFPGLARHAGVLSLAMTAVVVAVVLLPLRQAAVVLSLVAVAQLVLVAVLGGAAAGYAGVPAKALTPSDGAGPVLHAGATTALLFVCASLPLYLAGEVRGTHASVRRGVATGFGVTAATVALGALAVVAAGPGLLSTELPGAGVANAVGGRGLAGLMVGGAAASTLGVVAVEFLAVGRLLHAVTRRPVREVSTALAAVMLVASGATVGAPARLYRLLLEPSLVALWLAQIVVFACYPVFAARVGRRTPRSVAVATGLAAAAAALMGFGLYVTLSTGAPS